MNIFLITLLTVFAAAIGTVSGFGVSTVMVPVLSLFLPVLDVLIVAGVIHAFNDLWKMLLFRGGFDRRLLLFFAVPGVVASFAGASLLAASGQGALVYLGWFLIAYVVFLFADPRFRLPRGDVSAFAGGILYGASAGFFGIGGEIRAAFLAAYDLPKATYIFMNGAIGIAINITRVVAYFYGAPAMNGALLSGLIFYIPASFIGAFLGKKIVAHIPQKQFRLVVAAVIFFVALRFVWG
ncbi:MAG: sulfite exporter TauE/SafE family protein [Candidatus Niyogibacteria bacterium]|nr:sulfite exporter TauE/SafE family protein [Candidatus Niyogibacteria bacterium]